MHLWGNLVKLAFKAGERERAAWDGEGRKKQKKKKRREVRGGERCPSKGRGLLREGMAWLS
jgi:hypothetical protein